VFHLLKALDPGKASGPVDIPNCFLKDYAEYTAGMRSFKQQLYNTIQYKIVLHCIVLYDEYTAGMRSFRQQLC
jgi:hypothetical protein